MIKDGKFLFEMVDRWKAKKELERMLEESKKESTKLLKVN